MATFSSSFKTDGLISWLRAKGVDIDDCEKIRKAKFSGRTFPRLGGDEHFKELGIVLGARMLLESLVEEAKRDIAGPAVATDIDRGVQHTGGLTVKNLCKELECLTEWKRLGIDLDISPSQLEVIKKDHPLDLNGQKVALFEFIARNHKSLGITWESICDALEPYEGNLAGQIRDKYCSGAWLPSTDSGVNLPAEDPARLGPRHLKDIQEITFDTRAKWRLFGTQLGIPPPTLSAIDVQYHGRPDDCFHALLDTWLQGSDPKPTFKDLLAALRSPPVNSGYLATRIESFDEAKKQKIGFYL